MGVIVDSMRSSPCPGRHCAIVAVYGQHSARFRRSYLHSRRAEKQSAWN